MSNPNVKPSDRATFLDAVYPVSSGAANSTGWINAAEYHSFLALILVGVEGTAATVNAKLQQATDGTGTGAKDVPGKAITQFVKATNDNNAAMINCRADELDIANSFNFVRLTVTGGTAASLLAGVLLGFDGKNQAESHAAAMVQAV